MIHDLIWGKKSISTIIKDGQEKSEERSDESLKHLSDLSINVLKTNSCRGNLPAPVLTYVLLVVLALSSHGLLWSAVTVLRAPTQAVRHTVHFL